MEEAYRQARKRGEQGRRRAISQSEHPYLTDLDSLVAQLPLGQRENVGLRDIPLEMVVGTVTKGRQSAFSCNFNCIIFKIKIFQIQSHAFRNTNSCSKQKCDQRQISFLCFFIICFLLSC